MRTLKNPFVYGRVLTAKDEACARTELEERLFAAVRNDGRIALVGERRMGKSSVVQRTLEKSKVSMLRLNYHEVVDMADVVMRTTTELERFLHFMKIVFFSNSKCFSNMLRSI